MKKVSRETDNPSLEKLIEMAKQGAVIITQNNEPVFAFFSVDQNNPFILEYLANTHERMGNTSAAVEVYTQLADLQQSRRLSARAIEALHEVLRLRPDADDQRVHLARLLEESGSL